MQEPRENNDLDLVDALNSLAQDTHGLDDQRAMLFKAAERIEALVEHRDRLLAMVSEMTDPGKAKVMSLNPDGSWSISSPMVPLLIAGLAEMLDESQAVNYVEFQMEHPEKGPLVLCIQKKQGRTPHDFRQELEAKLDAVREVLKGECGPSGDLCIRDAIQEVLDAERIPNELLTTLERVRRDNKRLCNCGDDASVLCPYCEADQVLEKYGVTL